MSEINNNINMRIPPPLRPEDLKEIEENPAFQKLTEIYSTMSGDRLKQVIQTQENDINDDQLRLLDKG